MDRKQSDTQKGCLFLYLCSGDCISGDRDDSFSFLNKGNVNILIGFFGLGTCAMAVIGIWLGMKGFREREKIYTTCKVGITVNAVFLAVMVGLFVRGLCRMIEERYELA